MFIHNLLTIAFGDFCLIVAEIKFSLVDIFLVVPNVTIASLEILGQPIDYYLSNAGGIYFNGDWHEYEREA